MSTVEIRLSMDELCKQMAAMRIWLDERRSEPSGFSSHDDGRGVQVRIAFKTAREGEAFARRFGGRLNGPRLAA
jgi:hypothetical protein